MMPEAFDVDRTFPPAKRRNREASSSHDVLLELQKTNAGVAKAVLSLEKSSEVLERLLCAYERVTGAQKQ
jgi:hypothetical protein